MFSFFKKRGKFYILPLGGCQEVGRNCFLYVYGQKGIIIDFGRNIRPKSENDIYPNLKYVPKDIEIIGIFITHGHLDHIGGLFVCNNFLKKGTPIYICLLYTSPSPRD